MPSGLGCSPSSERGRDAQGASVGGLLPRAANPTTPRGTAAGGLGSPRMPGRGGRRVLFSEPTPSGLLHGATRGRSPHFPIRPVSGQPQGASYPGGLQNVSCSYTLFGFGVFCKGLDGEPARHRQSSGVALGCSGARVRPHRGGPVPPPNRAGAVALRSETRRGRSALPACLTALCQGDGVYTARHQECWATTPAVLLAGSERGLAVSRFPRNA